MEVPELLELVITVLIDVDGVLPLFYCHDISTIFNARLRLLNFDASTQKREGLLQLPESVPDVDGCGREASVNLFFDKVTFV